MSLPSPNFRCLLAPAAFRGFCSAGETAEIWRAALSREFPEAHLEVQSVADGGMGTLELLHPSIGGEEKVLRVAGPMGGYHDAVFVYNSDTRVGLVESSKVIGLEFLPKKSRDPLFATSYPLGLVLSKLGKFGARSVLVGLGDTVTLDYGVGMAAALGFLFTDEEGREALPGGRETARISRLTRSGSDPSLEGVTFTALADVRTPLAGDPSIARLSGPEKGADEERISILEDGGRSVVETVRKSTGQDISLLEMGGAGGGIAAMMKALLGAELVRGFDLVSRYTALKQKVEGADLILTGETRFDQLTMAGRAVCGVIETGAALSRPVSVICAVADPDVRRKTACPVLTGESLEKKKSNRLDRRDLAELAVTAVRQWKRREPQAPKTGSDRTPPDRNRPEKCK